ncbi:MAG: pyridoxal 5'-phosphate synthase glutaminase subunit PdxT [Oscillospiraceae bacterium]|nr:pyridoxal 5'-phosphate synthase glutaminase subunit PdxT [Oscillospiraceae bacterium]
MRVGILAVQGAFAEHAVCLERLGAEHVLIRQAADVNGIDRLILPGGESTVQRKLLQELDIFSPLQERISAGMPVLGTCAGLILLAQEIQNETPCFQTIPIRVCRNAYGRQLGSFSVVGNIGSVTDYPMRFIRAPYIADVLSDEVQVLNVTDNRCTAVQYCNCLGLAFHPELTDDLRLHELFLRL